MILLIDNYDSFTFNLYQILSELGKDVLVKRNNKITIEEIKKLKPERIIISPGPSTPQNAGISNDVIKHFGDTTPILGVCLGHQCIGFSYGGEVGRAKKIMHGKTSIVSHNGEGVFKGLPNPISVIRYHSLEIKGSSLPACLEVTAKAEDGTIMGVRNRYNKVQGIQFHPESFLSECGKELFSNFLDEKEK